MVPIPVMAFMHLCPLPVSARYITVTSIKWCQNQYWHICTFVQYQYWHGTLPVLALNGARAGIALMHFGPVPVLARSITGKGIKWCPYQYWHICTLVQYQYGHGPFLVLALNAASTGNVKEHYAK